MQKRWKATWVEAGEQQEFAFESVDNRAIARIDGRLLALAARIRLPYHFQLDEVDQEDGNARVLARR